MKNTLFASLAAGSLLFTSCGDKKVDTGVEKDGLKANEAVDNWKKDATEGRVASLWDSLPSSYQSDASGVVHSFGEKIDADLYNEAMKTVSAATKLLKDKKSIILEMASEMAPPSEKAKIDKASGSYDSIVGLLNSISTSDAKDVDGLKKLDLAKFLGEIQEHTKELTSLTEVAGGELNEGMDMIKSVTATLLSESGNTAEVEMSADDNRTKTVKLVKQDNRWIPADMVKEWPGMIKEAKGAIAEMTDIKPVQKESYLGVLRTVQAGIKELEAANTKEEMQAKFGEIMSGFGG